MPTVKGKWRWHNDVAIPPINIMENISFVSDGRKFIQISVESDIVAGGIITYAENDEISEIVAIGSGNKDTITVFENHINIDFGEIEQEVSDNFYNYLVANATHQSTIADKLAQIAENEQKVYDAGYAKGKSEGGGDSYYDTFWNHYQQNGNRTYYDNAFTDSGNQGGRWLYGVTYKPKYQVKPISAMNAYAYSKLPYEAIAEIDFSNCKEFYGCFNYYSGGNRIPPIDICKATRTQNLFGNSSVIETIDEILVSEASVLQYMFNGTTGLKEVRFNGTIGQNHLDFKSCTKLSKASIESVIGCLSNTTSNLTVTFSKASVNTAFETSEGANDGETSAEWIALRGTKSNWTFTLS